MAQRIINIGSSANKGDGDPIRTAFGKVNDNFTELYGKVTVLEDGTVAQVQDTKGSIFADDSTLLVDAINGIIPASVVSGTLNNNTVGTHTGPVDGDLVGSVFADNSTLLVDGVNGTIPYGVIDGRPTVVTDLTNDAGYVTNAQLVSGSLTINVTNQGTHTGTVDGDVNGSMFADDSTILVDAVNGEIPGYVKITDLKTALQDGAGDYAAFKAWVLANL